PLYWTWESYGVMMAALVQTQLISFNSLALRFQDDADTLAYYLLGDDALAARATKAAFARVYAVLFKHPCIPEDLLRLEVLRWVLKNCRPGGQKQSRSAADDELINRLLALPIDDRSVVILVDVLNLSYRAAALAVGCSEKELAKRLGRARLRLGRAARSEERR